MRTNALRPAIRRNHWPTALSILGLALGLPACDEGMESGEPVVGVGQVWAYSTRTEGVISASYRSLLGKTIATCPPSVAVSDNCIFSSCRFSRDALPVPVSAGVIGLSGLDAAVLLEPRAEPVDGTRYVTEERGEPLFQGGETVRFEVAGAGEVPAANGAVTAPEFLTVTAPVLPEPKAETEEEESEEEESELSVLVNRTKAFKVAWTPLSTTGGLLVNATLSARQEQDDEVVDYQYSCRADGSTGEITLSPDVLKHLPVSSELSEVPRLYVGRDAITRVYGAWEHLFAVSALDIFPLIIE